MKIRIVRTILFTIIVASAGAGFISCSGEKEVTSYPVANLVPKKFGHSIQQPVRKKGNLSQEFFQDKCDSGLQRSQVSLAENKTIATLPPVSGSNHSLIRQYRYGNLSDQAYDDELIAGLETSAETSVRKIKKYTAPDHGIIIPADDTTNTQNQDLADKTPGKKDPKDMNGFGIVSLVTGIVSIIGFPFLAPVAIVFGAIGLNKRQKGMAIAGFVLGIVTFVLYSLLIVLLLSSL